MRPKQILTLIHRQVNPRPDLNSHVVIIIVSFQSDSQGILSIFESNFVLVQHFVNIYVV